jgi:hypothetical protein
MSNNPLSDITTADMLENGSISEVTVDEDGDMHVEFDVEKLDMWHPAFFHHLEQMDLMELWTENPELVDRIIVDGRAEYTLSERGEEFLRMCGLTEAEPDGTIE